jgi:hypothetical protein
VVEEEAEGKKNEKEKEEKEGEGGMTTAIRWMLGRSTVASVTT